MGKKKKKAVYVVARGYKTGLFNSWDECKAAVTGFPGQCYKGFGVQGNAGEDGVAEATEWLAENAETPARSSGAASSAPVQSRKRPRAAGQGSELNAGRFSVGGDGGGVGANGPPQPPAQKHKPLYSAFAMREMERQGHQQGQGLGARTQGIANPIKAPNPLRGGGNPGLGSSAHRAQGMQLSSTQQHAVDLVASGRNVFLTGCAGTGKSLAIAHIVAALRNKFDDRRAVAICASTGVAAVQLGGQTLHSLAGVRTPQPPPTTPNHFVFRWYTCHPLEGGVGSTTVSVLGSVANYLMYADVLLHNPMMHHVQ